MSEDDDFDAALGQSVRAARKKAGMTLRDLQSRCGLSYSFLSDLENGKRSVSVRNFVALANALGVEPADMLPEQSHQWLDDVASL